MDIKPGGPVEAYRALLVELREKARNAAARGKPTMWDYFEEMAECLEREFADATLSDGGYAGTALAISQNAQHFCKDAPRHEAARAWALGVYARRILAAWGAGNGGPVSLKWLRDRVGVAS